MMDEFRRMELQHLSQGYWIQAAQFTEAHERIKRYFQDHAPDASPAQIRNETITYNLTRHAPYGALFDSGCDHAETQTEA